MSRNGAGTYSLPSNTWNPATPGVAILSDDWNATASDLATALTQSLAYDGQTTAVARIPFAQGISLAAGALATPSFAATGDLNTGIYFPGADQMSGVCGGVAAWVATSTTLTFPLATTYSTTLTVTGTFTANGNIVLGNASADTLTVNATTTFASPVTVPDASFTNAKLANMATQTIKGRTTAGTGAPEDLTATQATAILNAVVGDSGSGGTKGLVPAPGAGDAARRAFLLADGTWATSVPVGSIMMHGANAAPTGWLECDGSAVSRTTYAALFAVIGTVFGTGDGSTTFNVPDMRGEFARGWDDGRGVDSGRVFGSAQADEFEAHLHSVTPPASSDTSGAGLTATGTGGSEIITPYNTASTGGSETRPRNIALLYIIKF